MKKFLTIMIGLFLAVTAQAASKLTLQGKILKPDNSPVNGSSVNFLIQIRSPGAENCLLYQEAQTLSMAANPGIFNLTVGSGTRPASTVDGGFSLSQVFQNRNIFDLVAAPGACTNPATSYTPSTDDQRYISIQFDDGSGWQSVPVQKINSVPKAIDSSKVGGYDAAQLLRIADGVSTTQTELSGAQWTELLALIMGTSTNFGKPTQLNGVNLPALANGETMVWNGAGWNAVAPYTLPVGGTNGQILTSNGSGGATWQAPSGGGVSSFNTRTGAVVPAANDYTWAQIDKTTSSLADLATRSAADLSSGTLNDSRLSSNVPLKNASNVFTIGNQQINMGAATEVGLIVKGAAAQSANMIEIQDSTSALVYSFNASGTPSAATDVPTKSYVDSSTSTSGANYLRKDGTVALTGNWAVGSFDITGITNLGLSGYINQGGMAAPAVSAAGTGRIYFDSGSNSFKVSQNNGAYVDLVPSGGGIGGSGTSGKIPKFTASGTVGDSSITDNASGVLMATPASQPVVVSNSAAAILRVNSNSVSAWDLNVTSGTNQNLNINQTTGSTGAIVSNRAMASTTNPVAAATVDLTLSNTHTLATPGAAAIAISGQQDGGVYNIVIADTATPRTYTFTGCTTSYYKPANAATTSGSRTVYGLLTVKNGADWDCYITWSTGFL